MERLQGCSPRMRLRGVVARNLRRLRNETGISQEELADRAGVSGNYIGMLEREENAASVDVLEKIAEVFDVDAADLLRRPD